MNPSPAPIATGSGPGPAGTIGPEVDGSSRLVEGSLREQYAYVVFGIVYSPDAMPDPIAVFEETRAAVAPHIFAPDQGAGSSVPAVVTQIFDREEKAPAGETDVVIYQPHGLSEPQVEAFEAAPRVLALSFVERGDQAWALNRSVGELVAAFAAKDTDMVVYDPQTREAFSGPEYARLRTGLGEVPEARSHVSFTAEPQDRLVQLTTRGMVKFGLPDLRMPHVDPVDQDRAIAMMQLVCQRLVEGLEVGRGSTLEVDITQLVHEGERAWAQEHKHEAAKGRAILRVRLVRDTPPDENRVVELHFGDTPDKATYERQLEAYDQLFGPVKKPKERAPAVVGSSVG